MCKFFQILFILLFGVGEHNCIYLLLEVSMNWGNFDTIFQMSEAIFIS